MLGEQIGQEQGKVTVRRVLPGDDYRYVKMEITFETQGTVLGVPGMNIGTYTVFKRVGGQIYGEGQGIFMSSEGEGVLWNGHGVGQPSGDGLGIKLAASVAYQAPTGGKLAHLNGVLGVIEHETAGDDSVRSTFWEWKA